MHMLFQKPEGSGAFLYTRDVLPKKAGDSGEKVSCWPAPEDSTNPIRGNSATLK